MARGDAAEYGRSYLFIRRSFSWYVSYMGTVFS